MGADPPRGGHGVHQPEPPAGAQPDPARRPDTLIEYLHPQRSLPPHRQGAVRIGVDDGVGHQLAGQEDGRGYLLRPAPVPESAGDELPGCTGTG